MGNPWDISEATFLQSLDISLQQSSPTGLFFKPDGSKMYIIGFLFPQNIHEYDLSTNWDISSATFLQAFSVNPKDFTPQSLSFKPDGLKMYFIGSFNDRIFEYDLGSAWNISTASFLQQSPLVRPEDGFPLGIFFKPDGLKLYMVGRDSDAINEYNLGTAWNITTLAFLQLFDVSLEASRASGVFLKPDGLKAFIVDRGSDDVSEYDLSSAWNISSATFLQSFDVNPQDPSPSDLFFKPDGAKMYVLGDVNNKVYEYDIVELITDFSGTPRKKRDSLTTIFTDESNNNPISWSWKRRPSGIKGSYVEFSTVENPSEDFDVTIP